MEDETEYLDGTDPKKYEALVKLIVSELQQGAVTRLFSLSGRRNSLERVTGKRSLSVEEIDLIKSVMNECVTGAISSLLCTLDEPDEYMSSLEIYCDGFKVNGNEKLQALLHSEGWDEKYGNTEHVNMDNYLGSEG